MTATEIITICGLALTFVGTCITAWASVKKASIESRTQVAKVESNMERKFSELSRKVEKNSEHNMEQYLAILRLTVMAEEIPVSERIIAGKEYIDKGGNGDVKAFYEQFVKNHTK